LPTAGKGSAIRYGMLSADGHYRFMADCDWSMPPDWISEFWRRRGQAAITIASREAPLAIRAGEPWQRHVAGRVFSMLVNGLLPELKIQDTQCGFKLFCAPVANAVFSLQTLPGFSFDVEILYIARRLGYTIREQGVFWEYDPNSRVQLFRDSVRMFNDILTIHRNSLNGVYQLAPG